MAGKDTAAKGTASKASNPWTRTPTPTQLARWKAIREAKLKGLSLRAISQELGISRVTVRKYSYADKRTRQAAITTQHRNRHKLTHWTNWLSI